MGGQSGGSSTTTTTQELSKEQRALLEPVIPIAKNFLANPPSMFPGSGIVGFNPLQQQAQQMTMQAARGMRGMANNLPGDYRGLMRDTDFLTSGRVLHPGSNPALKGSIQAATRPIMEQFREQILPGIQGDAINSGGFGGTRQGIASGIAGGKATQAAADIASRMASENYQAGLGAMVGGMGQANQLLGQSGQIMSNSLLPARAVESVGAQRQAMQQAKLSEQVQRYVNRQMIPFAAAQDVAAMAFGMPGGTTRSQSTGGQSQSGGMLQTGIGAAASILPALIGKSERRFKENIKKVKQLIDGLFVYAFNMIGETMQRIGLMVDEVEMLYPQAIHIQNGIKHVDYLNVPTWHIAFDRRLKCSVV